MFSPSFTSNELKRLINNQDKRRNTKLTKPIEQDKVALEAYEIFKQGFIDLEFTQKMVRGKPAYSVNELQSSLVLRKVNNNLKKISYAKQSDRRKIIKRLKLLSQEGLQFNICKFDIKSFYESIDKSALKELVDKRLFTSPSTRNVIISFIERCETLKLEGLPRGVSLSASLAEFYLQDFDQSLAKKFQPYFYARYVDDIVLITAPIGQFRDFKKKLQKELPKGLTFNQKSKLINLSEHQNKNQSSIDNKFDFLGYEFSIYTIHRDKDNSKLRRVTLDISQKKVRRMKTRIALAFSKFLSDGNFDVLKRRIYLLAFNAKILGDLDKQSLYSGNVHSYDLIDLPSQALTDVNKFYRGIVLKKSGSLSGRLDLVLSSSQKKELLNICFVAGFESKIHFNYDLDEFEFLNIGWSYES